MHATLPPGGEDMNHLERPQSARNLAVDTMRLIAIFCVICLHAAPFSPDHMGNGWYGWQVLYLGISTACRFAVPFFFCVSGYYWGGKIRRGQSPSAVSPSMFKRIGIVFVVWSAFFLSINYLKPVIGRLIPWFPGAESIAPSSFAVSSFARHPLRLLFEGTAQHLWFLPALLSALAVAWLFVALRQERLLLAVAIALFVYAVLGRAYASTSIGISPQIFGFHCNTRDGPFFSTIFFASGYFLSAHLPRPQWSRWGISLLAAGCVLHRSEIVLIHTLFHAPPVRTLQQDFVFGTYAMGLGATMLALAAPSWLSRPRLARWGRWTLGIYCIHPIFIHQKILCRLHSAVAEVLYPIAVLLLSLFAVWLLARVRWTRSLVQ